MPFDPSTAKLSSGFDPSTAKPVEQPVGDVDTSTGLSFYERSMLAAMDNPDEKKAYLEKSYGPGSIKEGLDNKGNKVPYIVKDGKKIAIEGGGKFSGFMAGVAGSSPELAGAVSGAAEGGSLGSALGPWGTAGGLLGGAAIGAMSGHSVKESAKMASGTYQKDMSQGVSGYGKQAGAAIEGEMAGGVVGKGASKLIGGDWAKWLFDTSPESRETTGRLLDRGAIPSVKQSLPGARHLQRTEIIANAVSGPPKKQVAANIQYVDQRLKEVLVKSGMDESKASALAADISNPTSKHSVAELGEIVKKSTEAHKKSLEAIVDSHAQETHKAVDESLRQLEHVTLATKPGSLGVDIEAGLRTARSDFSKSMSSIYGRVDKMIGGKPIVSPDGIVREANRQLKLSKGVASTGEASELFNKLGIEVPSKDMTLAQAQRMRSILNERASSITLTPGIEQREIKLLAESVDRAIQGAALKPEAKSAISLLNKADAVYREGIRKFEETGVTKLIRDLKSGVSPDPSKIAQSVIVRGMEGRAQNIKYMVPNDVWRRVGGADFENMLASSRTIDANGREVIQGSKLLRELMNRGDKMLETVYGKKTSAELMEFARAVASKDGAVPIESLKNGSIKSALESFKTSQANLDQYLSKNFVKEFTNPTKDPDELIRWIVNPKNESKLLEASKHFGPNSPQMNAIREGALRDLGSKITLRALETEKSAALKEILSSYSERQQMLLFPNGLYHELSNVSKELEHLFPGKSGDQAMASLSAGAVLQQSLSQRLYHQAVYGVARHIIQSKPLIRYLALGLQEGGATRVATHEIMENMVRAEIQKGASADDVSHMSWGAEH